jgi:hypothetical protein
MPKVVHLKWGEEPVGDSYLVVTRQGRIRGEDFYVRPSAALSVAAAVMAAFASLESALTEAQAEARRLGVDVIYVQLA